MIRDIAPVACIAGTSYGMLVNPSFPAKVVTEFIAYAKANPRKVNKATTGTGTGDHIAGDLFKMMAGVDMVHVLARGAAACLIELVRERLAALACLG